MTGVITDLRSWEALDSRGRPTVAARVCVDGGFSATALAPSGASAGSHEAAELRDGGERYQGRGVRRAVEHVRSRLAPALRGIDVSTVDAVLRGLDPTPGFAGLGANAVIAVSLAALRARAAAAGTSVARLLAGDGPLLLPMPMVNIVSGGAHAGGLVDIQDVLVIPIGATSFAQAIEWAAAVRAAATTLARAHPGSVLVADEGGLGLPLRSNREALELVTDAIRAAGLEPGTDVSLGIDVAATQLVHESGYRFASEDRTLRPAQLVDEVTAWCADSPVVSVEDIVAEDDWDGWRYASEMLGDRVELVGDDLFVTSPSRLDRGIQAGIGNSVLVKVNQNGLVSGAAEVIAAAHAAGYRTVVSARSGDTEEDWLADLAVGWRAGQIKVGSTHRSERTAKWNRLLELEATEQTTFAGPWQQGRPRDPRAS